ncbi:MAG: phosphatidylinositol-specific phospholipase C/glycerophosphodiester phosphodiesterase family protein [Turicibacter sp.]
MKAFIDKYKIQILGISLGIVLIGFMVTIYFMYKNITSLELDKTNLIETKENYEEVITDYSNKLCGYERDIEHLSTPITKEELVYVAHALGGIDGYPYTNSLEAFESNYEEGYKLFEVDLLFTSDDELVARHEWSKSDYERFEQLELIDLSEIEPNEREEYVPTLEQFKNMPVNGTYTPMTFDDIIGLLQKYPDIAFVTDTKWSDSESVEKSFTAIVEKVKDVDEKLLDRILPQLYSLEMYDEVNSIHPFNNYIYTMYQETHRSNYEIIEFINENENIAFVTMPQFFGSLWGAPRFDLLNQLQYLKKPMFFHTINDDITLEELLYYGASGVYTDELFYSGDQHQRTCTYEDVIVENELESIENEEGKGETSEN